MDLIFFLNREIFFYYNRLVANLTGISFPNINFENYNSSSLEKNCVCTRKMDKLYMHSIRCVNNQLLLFCNHGSPHNLQS